MRFDHNNKYEINGFDSAMNILLFVAFWPIPLTTQFISRSRRAYAESFEDRKNQIMSRCDIERMDPNNRTELIDVPEKDLKFLLKSYRRKRIKLNRKSVELIRDELMHRNAERSLLR